MKKKIAMFIVGILMSVAGNAQSQNDELVFNKGKMYANAQLSGLNLNYTSYDKFKFNAGVKAGYMISNDFMVLAHGQLGLTSNDYDTNEFRIGGGARYYIEQNGLYLGAMASWAYKTDIFNDFRPEVNVGYAFFISRTVTIEPEIYYEQSFVNHSKYSGAGLRIGVGIYLDKLPDFR